MYTGRQTSQSTPYTSDLSCQQSQLINQKCRQFLLFKDSTPTPISTFTPLQLQTITKRFTQLCNNDHMTYQQFRRGLGLLGREDSFICRIFNLIDDDGDGRITLGNYVHYLGVILRGSDLEKARFGWLILTEGNGDIDFKDFMDLFQEISVVWNALTGQIITPKRKYIEELFHTFDVDQDQAITFQDFRLFFNQHLRLFGWFQYFNGLEIDQQQSRVQLQKVREKLRKKIKMEGFAQGSGRQQLKLALRDSQIQIQKKLAGLAQSLSQTGDFILRRHRQIRQYSQNQSLAQPSTMSTKSINSSSSHTSDQYSSIRSLYKYNHHQSTRQLQLSKISMRKQRINRQNRQGFNQQVMGELKMFLEKTEGIMKMCQGYREGQTRLRKYSPTKLKQMQVKLNLFDQVSHVQAGSPQRMTVYFGHQNWNLVLNIMVGLRKSIKYLSQLNQFLQIKQDHFTQRHQFFLGNKSFLSGKGPQALKNMQSFLFIQYAPVIFQRLRRKYGVTDRQYQRSVGPQSLLNQLLTGDLTALNQKCSTGKSGAFFYLTSDNRIFLKTITKNQYIFFTKIIKDYYEHMSINHNTLIVRVYGLYKLKVFMNKQKIKTIYFIGMQNIFGGIQGVQGWSVGEVYDLKGSSVDRIGKEGGELKDQDWVNRGKKIRLNGQLGQVFKQQIRKDSKFFKRNNINDYSLMVAIVNYPPDALQNHKQIQGNNVFKSLRGGVLSRQSGKMYILSIIDFLTVFETLKTFQYIIKTAVLGSGVSCIPPRDYSHRFREFVWASVE